MERIRTVVGWLGVLGFIVLVVIASENQQFHASFMFALLERYVPHLTVHQKYLLVFWTRKTIHVTGYAVLALCCYYASVGTRGLRRRPFLSALLLSLAVASIDEFIQSFQVGRAGTVVDVAIDGIGIVLALLLLRLIQYKYRNQAQRERD